MIIVVFEKFHLKDHFERFKAVDGFIKSSTTYADPKIDVRGQRKKQKKRKGKNM